MADKKKMPVSGGGPGKGKLDGVSGSPATGEPGQVNGRLAGGESGGGAYPNPHDGKASSAPGFMGHGGQSEIAYHGAENPNATTTSGDSRAQQSGVEGTGSPARKPHSVQAGGRVIDVIEDSGVAAAEATGKVATDAPYEREQESPGSG